MMKINQRQLIDLKILVHDNSEGRIGWRISSNKNISFGKYAKPFNNKNELPIDKVFKSFRN